MGVKMLEDLKVLIQNLEVDMNRDHHFDVLEDCERITDFIAVIRKLAIEGAGDFVKELQSKGDKDARF